MATPGSAYGGSNVAGWKNPSESNLVKYNLRPLPNDFEPTEEEEQLLGMYEVMRQHERVAARLKEEAARAKLAARDAEFQQQKLGRTGTTTNKRKRAQNPSKLASDDEDDESENEHEKDGIYSDEEDEDDTLHARREAKLSQLRDEVEVAKHAIAPVDQQEVDALREQHLAITADADDAPIILKRKRKDDENEATGAAPATSLISNLMGGSTPPHEFSSKLELTIKDGKILFPEDPSSSFKWTPPEGVFSPNDGAFQVDLPNFDVSRAQTGSGNNTVAIKFMAPSDSNRFSINIAAVDHDFFDNVLFHFNPRKRERGGQLVVNDKRDKIWGQAIALPLSQVPLIFGQTACTLLIQINGEGFDIFIENKHCVRLEHRKELPVGKTNLILQFPSTDDYGKPENWTVYKVWWGHRPIMAKEDVSGIPGVNSFNSDHPRKVFVSSLEKIYTEADVDLRRAELERAFQKYGGDRGVEVIAPTNATYAFIEMESERMTDLALHEMGGKYRMNRARWSRHEALQEKRSAAEAAKLGGEAKKDRNWD